MIYLGACMVDVLGRHASKRNVTKHSLSLAVARIWQVAVAIQTMFMGLCKEKLLSLCLTVIL